MTQLNKKRWLILQIINMGTLMSTLDVGIVNVSLPTIAAQFSVSLAQIQWVSTIYLLTMVALLPFMGKLSDAMDRRKIYSWGFFVFGIGSLLIALSQGLTSILISRCIQGVGATMIMANSQAMVRHLFPDHERGRALGINAIVISIGTLSGPALGGLLLEFVEWPWLFLINVPFGLAAFVFGLLWFPMSDKSDKGMKFDLVGSVLLAAGAAMLMSAAESMKQDNALSFSVQIQGLSGIGLLVMLGLYQTRITHGILDRELFRNSKVFLGNVASFLVNLTQMATMMAITFYMQGPMQLTPGFTGLILMIQAVMMGVVSPFAGWFRDRYGGYFPITYGPLFCAVSMLPLAVWSEVTLIGISFQLALFGIGTGLFHATNNAEIMSAAPAAKISLAGSLLALVRYLGMIAGIGIAILFVGNLSGQTAEVVVANEYGFSMQLLFLFCFVLCLLTTAIGKLRPRDKPFHENASTSA